MQINFLICANVSTSCTSLHQGIVFWSRNHLLYSLMQTKAVQSYTYNRMRCTRSLSLHTISFKETYIKEGMDVCVLCLCPQFPQETFIHEAFDGSEKHCPRYSMTISFLGQCLKDDSLTKKLCPDED